MVTTPFPDLPHDIQRMILECSAYHDRAMALKLVRLSRKVRNWIDPILYRHVTLEYPSQAEAFVRTLETSRKQPHFFPTQVKVLCFAYGIDLHHAVKILSACKGVTSLASWLELSQISSESDLMRADLEAFSALLTSNSDSLRLHRLSMVIHDFFCVPDPDFTVPVLQNVTHLDIYQGSDHFSSWTWKGFSQLSNLTHLSFDLSLSSPLETVVELLPFCPPGLQMCVVLLSTRNSMSTIAQYCEGNTALQDMASGKVDQRIVIGTNEPVDEVPRYGDMVILHPYEEVLKDWSFSPDGEDDIWEKAEHVMAKRKQRSLVNCVPSVSKTPGPIDS